MKLDELFKPTFEFGPFDSAHVEFVFTGQEEFVGSGTIDAFRLESRAVNGALGALCWC